MPYKDKVKAALASRICRDLNKALGLCVDCGKRAVNANYCVKHKMLANERRARSHRKAALLSKMR